MTTIHAKIRLTIFLQQAPSSIGSCISLRFKTWVWWFKFEFQFFIKLPLFPHCPAVLTYSFYVRIKEKKYDCFIHLVIPLYMDLIFHSSAWQSLGMDHRSRCIPIPFDISNYIINVVSIFYLFNVYSSFLVPIFWLDTSEFKYYIEFRLIRAKLLGHI